jgi:hypothetical protein
MYATFCQRDRTAWHSYVRGLGPPATARDPTCGEGTPRALRCLILQKALPNYQELGDQAKANDIKLRITEAHRAARETGQFGVTTIQGALNCAWIDDLKARMLPRPSTAPGYPRTRPAVAACQPLSLSESCVLPPWSRRTRPAIKAPTYPTMVVPKITMPAVSCPARTRMKAIMPKRTAPANAKS